MCVCNICGKKSDKESVEDWVQCDDCELWFHFECVGVDESVQYRNWSCASCKKEATSVGSLHTRVYTMQQSTTSTTSTPEQTVVESASSAIGTAQPVTQPNRIDPQGNTDALKLNEVTTTQNGSSEASYRHQLMMAMLEEKEQQKNALSSKSTSFSCR